MPTRESVLETLAKPVTGTVEVAGEEWTVRGLSTKATAEHIIGGYSGSGEFNQTYLLEHAADILIAGCMEPKFEPTDREAIEQISPQVLIAVAGKIIELTFREVEQVPNS